VQGLYRSAELKRQLEEELSRDAGISRVSASCLTGSVLVLYNSGRGHADILNLLKAVVNGGRKPEGNRSSGTPAPRRRPSARTRPDSGVEVSPPAVSTYTDRNATLPAAASLWHIRKSSDVLETFGSDAKIGLTENAYAENLKRFGPNLLPESVPRSAWSIFVDQFKSIPVLLLGIAAGVSLLTGGIADAVVIAGVVAVNAAIGFVTESRSERTIRSLKTLVRPYALVKRAGEIRRIGVGDVVPGDVLVLRPGAYVAGDARLLAARNLSVDESALTGERYPYTRK
jgi:Ca2+-transporting ATPase